MITDPIEIELDVCRTLDTFVEKHSDGQDKTPADVQLALIELAARDILGASATMCLCDPNQVDCLISKVVALAAQRSHEITAFAAAPKH